MSESINTEKTANLENIPQAVLDEAMLPELSDDYFVFEGRKVQLRPLKVKYQKQFAKAFAPIADSVALDLAANSQIMYYADDQGRMQYRNKGFGDLSVADWVLLSKALLEQVEVLPRLIQILCHDDGFLVTDEEIENSRMQVREMQQIILRFCKKADGIERQIADFFESVQPAVEKELSALLELGKQKIQAGLAKVSENTAS